MSETKDLFSTETVPVYLLSPGLGSQEMTGYDDGEVGLRTSDWDRNPSLGRRHSTDSRLTLFTPGVRVTPWIRSNRPLSVLLGPGRFNLVR